MKKTKPQWETKFDKKFTVRGEGKQFFDVEDGRTADYIQTHKPSPKEIKHFIREQRREAVEEVLEEVKDILTSDGGGMASLYKFLGYKVSNRKERINKHLK